MKETRSKFPPPIEWDFRKVADSALEMATLYEYARTSNFRAAVEKILNSKRKRKTTRQHIFEVWEATDREGGKADLMAMGKHCPGDLWTKFFFDLSFAMKGNEQLCRLIMMARADFPAPWLNDPLNFEKSKKYDRLEFTPAAIYVRKLIWMAEHHDDPFDALKSQLKCENSMGESRWVFEIWDWKGATRAELISEFGKWLRREAKNHPEMKKKGRAGQLPIAPLAWLAAYRLHEAGVTFEQAQIRLEKESNHYGHLPKYSEKSAWSDAIKNARNKLRKFESWDDNDYNNWMPAERFQATWKSMQ